MSLCTELEKSWTSSIGTQDTFVSLDPFALSRLSLDNRNSIPTRFQLGGVLLEEEEEDDFTNSQDNLVGNLLNFEFDENGEIRELQHDSAKRNSESLIRGKRSANSLSADEQSSFATIGEAPRKRSRQPQNVRAHCNSPDLLMSRCLMHSMKLRNNRLASFRDLIAWPCQE